MITFNDLTKNEKKLVLQMISESLAGAEFFSKEKLTEHDRGVIFDYLINNLQTTIRFRYNNKNHPRFEEINELCKKYWER